MLPPCPHLPPLRAGLDWRSLNAHRGGERGGRFYRACLDYGQVLWCNQRPARALLCLDRAFAAGLTGEEPEVREWPLPYAAMAWIMRETPPTLFLGNPRVHFQHYADRMNEPRREQRQWRAWACWALACAELPHLPGDPRHVVEEPSLEAIANGLTRFGLPGEDRTWLSALREADSFSGLRHRPKRA